MMRARSLAARWLWSRGPAAHADERTRAQGHRPRVPRRLVGGAGDRERLVTTLSRTSLVVLGPDQTRLAYGDHLDQVLVKCAGDATCVAKIGQKVAAAEVILVGSASSAT